jgi:hypothetical protein
MTLVERKVSPTDAEPQEVVIVHPLDRKVLSQNGYVPSWSEVSNELDLNDLPRGEKKLFQAFYRAQRLYALGKRTKGHRLITALDGNSDFKEFEIQNASTLDRMVRIVRKGH